MISQATLLFANILHGMEESNENYSKSQTSALNILRAQFLKLIMSRGTSSLSPLQPVTMNLI